MDIFEKLAELNNETFSTLKWIFLFVSCIAFFVSLLVVKPSKKDVSKAVTFSSAVSFAVAASGFVYCDIIDLLDDEDTEECDWYNEPPAEDFGNLDID